MACEQPIQLGVFTAGEKPAPLTYTYTDFNGVVIDLTGYSGKFVWREQTSPASLATTGNAVISAPATGKVTYTWTGQEFQNPGKYLGQFWVGNATNRWASVQIRWTVQASVGPVPAI